MATTSVAITPADKRHRLAFAAGLVSLFILGMTFVLHERNDLRAESLRATLLTADILEFERLIGYGGFIHHFKNAVLRPDEADYRTNARTNIDLALDQLQSIKTLLASESSVSTFDAVEETLQQYRAKIATIEKNAASLDARTLDKLVRISDEAAVVELAELLQTALNNLQDSNTREERTLWINSIVYLLLLASLVVYLVVSFYRESAMRSQLLYEKAVKQAEVLGQANQELSEFAYAAAHDLKAPATTMCMLLEELSEHSSLAISDESRELVEAAKKTVKRMQHYMDELLRYTNIVGEEMPVDKVDLNEIMRNVEDDIHAFVADTEATITADPMPVIEGNAMQLQTLLQNLVCNAIKYQRGGVSPVIHLSAETDSQNSLVRIRVEDNGMGIDALHAENIFKLFTRLHTQKDIAGSGLGLAMCRRIALRHGGSIRLASSTPGSGSVFEVALPLTQGMETA